MTNVRGVNQQGRSAHATTERVSEPTRQPTHVEVYAHAAILAAAGAPRALGGDGGGDGPAQLARRLDDFTQLQARVNQSCEYGNVPMGGLIGQDCYAMDSEVSDAAGSRRRRRPRRRR